MRLAATGTQGQVVTSLVELCQACDVEIRTVGRPEIDFLDTGGLATSINGLSSDVMINLAAYTAVDKAESEPDVAMRVNSDAAGIVSAVARQYGIPIIHLSTDYVFDGALDRPYEEEDPTSPINIYGFSKLAGEKAVAASNDFHVILRTAWVYSPFGANFVKTMLRLGETRASLNVVADQFGAPTYAPDIAAAILAIARKISIAPANPELFGTFHLSGAGEASWADFAEAIFQEATLYGRHPVKINRISTDQYPTASRRPANSRLNTQKLKRTYDVELPDWRQSVKRCVARILDRHDS